MVTSLADTRMQLACRRCSRQSPDVGLQQPHVSGCMWRQESMEADWPGVAHATRRAALAAVLALGDRSPAS